jgi:hypothetical protein
MGKLAPDELKARVAKALETGGGLYAPSDIRDAIKDGRMQAWTKDDSLVVTEILGFPNKLVLHVVFAVGELDDVLALQTQFEEFGRKHGCERVVMEGRPGWDKILPKEGWTKEKRVRYEKVL